MSRAPNAARPAPASSTAAGPKQDAVGRIVELRASANLMLLDTGLYCLFQEPGVAPAPQDGSGLPGVRLTLPPNGGLPGNVTIRGLHDDGWLGPQDGAALVQVRSGPAQVLVTVYQSPTHPADTAPRLKVVRLEPDMATADVPAPAPVARAAVAAPTAKADIVAHVQRSGDVGVTFGEWVGRRGSKLWVEGFGLTAPAGVDPEQIEYQAVLGRGWLSPWISAGKFCGSRGMALPLLGFNLRLQGAAAAKFDCSYRASFVDGAETGPLAAGKTCESPTLAPLESFMISLSPKSAAKSGKASARSKSKAPAGTSAARKAPAGKASARRR